MWHFVLCQEQGTTIKWCWLHWHPIRKNAISYLSMHRGAIVGRVSINYPTFHLSMLKKISFFAKKVIFDLRKCLNLIFPNIGHFNLHVQGAAGGWTQIELSEKMEGRGGGEAQGVTTPPPNSISSQGTKF
jgi:hypothetical protein